MRAVSGAAREVLKGGRVSELSSNDVRAIEEVHRRWMEAELAGDSLAVLRLCTDDIVWIPPDIPLLEGKEAISIWLKSTEEVQIKRLEVTDLGIAGNQTWAYKTGNYSTAYTASGSSEVREAKGTHLWILKKSASGTWLVAIVTWSVYNLPPG
jgi:uncharacterized protein (TIGR02246 family)